jgi:hypothetical protein
MGLDEAIKEVPYNPYELPWEPSGGHYIEVDKLTLWYSIFFWSVTCGLAGYLGNKGKLKTLVSSGWKILKKVEAKSSKEALAFIVENINNDASVSKSHIEKTSSSPDKLEGVAGEIESFAKLRDRGVITEDEFDKKKKQLLNL